MSFCLSRHLAAGCIGVLALAGSLSASGLVTRSVAAPRVRSIVRADSQGRLVRRIVVSPRLVPPRVVASPAASASASVSAVDVPAIVESTARKYDVDPLLVHSVIAVESAYNPYAVSPKGAQGLMQLMPGTARRFGVSNTFDPVENIEGGVRYLKYLSTLFPQDPRLAVAAYNAGEGAVWKYNYQIPPYPETEQYVQRVAKKYGQARKSSVKKAAPVAPEPPAGSRPAGPVYASVQTWTDSEGRLHMRTVAPPSGAAVEAGTP
jgi:soluble lytic murein transglycosylase-like protein